MSLISVPAYGLGNKTLHVSSHLKLCPEPVTGYAGPNFGALWTRTRCHRLQVSGCVSFSEGWLLTVYFPSTGCLPVSLYRKWHKCNTVKLIHNSN